MGTFLQIALWGLGLGLAAYYGGTAWLRHFRTRRDEQAIRQFRFQREQLEAKFFDVARSLGKPRDLIWIGCDWQDDVTFARDLSNGLLAAFVAVNIRFEAVAGGDMEDVTAVSTIRDATAVFHFGGHNWGTGGKALFNMNPRDALVRLEGQFAPVIPAQDCRLPV